MIELPAPEYRTVDQRIVDWHYHFWMFGMTHVYPAWGRPDMVLVSECNAIGWASK